MSSPKRTGSTPENRHGQRAVAEEEAELWREITKNVKPLTLKNNPSQTSLSSSASSYPKKYQHQQKLLIPNALMDSSPVKPAFQHGKAPGLDRKTQTRMRRGQVRLDGRLDLHGMTRAEAYRVLLKFVETAYNEGRQSILVITGKGLTRDGEIGVLRRAVPAWLNEAPMNAWIKGFDHAARQHGGEGALYVLIRRKR